MFQLICGAAQLQWVGAKSVVLVISPYPQMKGSLAIDRARDFAPVADCCLHQCSPPFLGCLPDGCRVPGSTAFMGADGRVKVFHANHSMS